MLRSLLFNFIFWPGFAIQLILMYPFAFFFNQKQTFSIAYRNMTQWLIFCLKVFAGIKHEIKGNDILQKQLETGPVIIGCNHQSAWETFIFAILFDELSIVIKKELLSLPVAGLYFRKLECIPLDRSSGISSIKSLMKYGKIALQKNQSILIFPNGTRASAYEHAEYKSGLFALYKTLEIPVIPCFINSGKFWPRKSFKKSKGTIILEFKEALQPGLNKDEFMKIFEERMK